MGPAGCGRTFSCYSFRSDFGKEVMKRLALLAFLLLSIATVGEAAAPVFVTMQSSPNPSSYGQLVTLKAFVTSSGNPVNEGTITFRTGSAEIRNLVTVSGGVATFITDATALNAREHFLAADYSGTANFLPASSPSISHVVTPATTTTTLTISSSAQTYGRTSTVDVMVTPVGQAGATGQVTLRLGSQVIGTKQLANGLARFTFFFFKPGAHALTADYAGDSNHQPSVSPAANVLVASSAANRADLNGDGRADVLWRSSATGEVGYWLLDGASIIGSGSLGNVPLSLSITGVGDFDGDGRSDILWRDDAGNLGMWLMNGGTIAAGAGFGPVTRTLLVAGIGDFDGDGKSDILWRDTIAGDVGMWLMNGTSIASGAFVGQASPALEVAAVGDLDGNGKDDLLWYQSGASGDVAVWLMSGSTIAGGGFLASLDPDLGVAGLTDFNGDGKADILWRNRATGDVGMWLMNGTALISGAFVGNSPLSLVVRGTADRNGDGRGDVLWFHRATGDVGLWLLNGASITAGSYVGGAPPGLEIQ